MKRSFVVLGGSGDLTGRLLLPSLAELYERGVLDGDVQVLAVSQQDWDDAAYRDWARERLTAHAEDLALAALSAEERVQLRALMTKVAFSPLGDRATG